MRRDLRGLKKPDGPIQGTLDDQDILYSALENQYKFFHSFYDGDITFDMSPKGIEEDTRYWADEVDMFYETMCQENYNEICTNGTMNDIDYGAEDGYTIFIAA